jgi:hypothetical protein
MFPSYVHAISPAFRNVKRKYDQRRSKNFFYGLFFTLEQSVIRIEKIYPIEGGIMRLAEYFEKAEGIGILSTADSNGKVNAAVYGRPHVIDEKTIAFIAADRLTHANLQDNPSAAYLFKENGSFTGKRLYLTKSREEENSPQKVQS